MINVQVFKLRKILSTEDVVKVLKLTVRKIKLFDFIDGLTIKPFVKKLFSQSTNEHFLTDLLLLTLDWEPIENFELVEVEDHVGSVVGILGQSIATDTKNNELSQDFDVLDFLNVLQMVVPKVQLHEIWQRREVYRNNGKS